MITFLELGSWGRLGNQLFQYAALKSLSLDRGYEIKLSQNLYNSSWHGQKCLLNNFNLDFKFLEKDDLSKVTTYNQTGNAHDFDEQFFNLPDNTNLHGFFQNLKYFDHNQEQIKKEFSFKESVQIKCKQYLNDIIDNKKPVVSVHLRRPDNKNIRLNQHSINYYTKTSINYFDNDCNFLFFAGGATSNGNNNLGEIDYLKETYKGDNIYYSDTNDTIMDLCLMSMCDHNIIAQDSTYSWWAAYLNSNPNKIVVAPRHLNTSIIDTNDPSNIPTRYDDYYPNEWTLMG